MELDERIAGLSEEKRELLARWLREGADPDPVSAAYVAAGPEPGPLLVDIWRDELEVERIGIDDDYFELGGDSIHAIVIVSRAQEAGVAVDPQDLFECRTVRAVAERATVGAVAAEAAARAVSGEHPLTPLQQGMLYHAVGGST